MQAAHNLIDNRSRSYSFVLVLASCLLTALAVYYLFVSDTFLIKRAKFLGQFTHLSVEHLRTKMKDELRGNFFSFDVQGLKKLLISDPWIQSVRIKRVWPNSIHIQISERDAVAYWGKTQLLSHEGVLFEPDILPQNLPKLSGPNGSKEEVLHTFKWINSKLLSTPRSLAVLHLSDRNAWTLGLDNGLKVRLGSRDTENRLNRFIQYLIIGEQFAQAEYIDLRYPNGFAVLFRNLEMSAR